MQLYPVGLRWSANNIHTA